MKKTTFSKLFLSLILCLLFNTNSFSQEELCGTITTQEDIDRLNEAMPQIKAYEEQFYALQQSRSSTAPTSIPVKIHIIRTTAGTGGLSITDFEEAFDLMNTYYAATFMEFFVCDGINYIDDTNFYNYETNDEPALTAAHQVPNLINIYFTETVAISGGGAACGYAYFPGGPDVILMDNQCATNGSTLIHEMGHFFSLAHTHGPSNTTLTTELVDGSNCDTDGDFICDTPADPRLSGLVTPACQYTGTAVDANGQAFMPDTHNFMSYSRQSCRDSFTLQQLARIYAGFQVSRNYFECPTINVDFAADVNSTCNSTLDVNFTDSSVGATSWEWDVDGDDVVDYTTQNPFHTYAASGSYDVNLKISDGTTTISKTFVKYIKVGTEENLPVNENLDALTVITDIDWSSEDVTGNGYNWLIIAGQTPSPNTGPLTDNSGTGKYIYTEATGSADSDVAVLISNCIEINADNAILEFAYHMFGGSMGELHVDIDSGSGFVNDVTTAIVGSQQAAQGDAYLTRQVDLSGYANENIILRFRAIRGFDFQSDIAIDDISITGTLSTPSFEFDKLIIYPNPVNNNVLYIETNSQGVTIDFSINNLLGQAISNGRLQQNQIDVSSLSQGTYFLTLTVGSSKVVKKFIKQ